MNEKYKMNVKYKSLIRSIPEDISSERLCPLDPSHSRYLESITEPDCPLTINNGNDELELKYILLCSFTSVRTTTLYDNFFF